MVAVNEIIDLTKKSKRGCLMFKVYFEKLYDSMSWGFQDYMMRRLWFDVRWRSWIQACVLGEFFCLG